MNLVNELIEHLQPLGALSGISLEPLRRYFERSADSGDTDPEDGRPVVSLARAGALVAELAAHESLLLLSAPGVGKTDIITAAARRAGLRCCSLLGTQLAPEDITGVPRIENQRTVFYPPRVILPEDDKPFCLFLDELPAAAPDVQKAMYSLLLERRIGEHALPRGSWVVAAGNRVDDGAFVRPMSSALLNRLFVIHVVPTVHEWLAWAATAGVRADIRAYVQTHPDALLRKPDEECGPFSSPRAWASLSQALDRIARAGALDETTLRALAHGRISPEDADRFCEFISDRGAVGPGELYIDHPDRLPAHGLARWSALTAIREAVSRGGWNGTSARAYRLLTTLDAEERCMVLSGLVRDWLGMVGPAVLRDMITTWIVELGDYDYAEAS